MICKSKFSRVILFATLLTISTSPVRAAGIPTINIPDFVIQVTNWLTQYGQEAEQIKQYAEQIEQYKQQLEQYKKQYSALTGSRGMSNMFKNYTDALKEVVPLKTSENYQDFTLNGVESLTAAAKEIRDKLKIYDCEGQNGDAKKYCQMTLAKAALDKSYSDNVLKMTATRQENIQRLQDQISLTNDPKAIAELQARIATESAHVMNDQVRVAALALQQENSQRLIEQQARERDMKALSKKVDTSFTFELPNH